MLRKILFVLMNLRKEKQVWFNSSLSLIMHKKAIFNNTSFSVWRYYSILGTAIIDNDDFKDDDLTGARTIII